MDKEQRRKENVNDKGTISNSFKTFEAFIAQIKMFWHMSITIGIILIIIELGIIWTMHNILQWKLLTWELDQKDICIKKKSIELWALDISGLGAFSDNKNTSYACEGEETQIETAFFKQHFEPYVKSYIDKKITRNSILTLSVTGWWIPIAFWITLRKLSRKHVEATKDAFLRGKRFLDEKDMPMALEPFAGKGRMFDLNEYVQVPEKIVTRHNFVAGKPGSGKSQFILKFIRKLIAEDVKTIIHDFKGDFIPSFYDPNKHYIFNPVDCRHLGLDFNELTDDDSSNENIKKLKLDQQFYVKEIEDLKNPEHRENNINLNLKMKFFREHPEYKQIKKRLSEKMAEVLSQIPQNIKNNVTITPDQITDELIVQHFIREIPRGWTVFNELHNLMDVEAFANSVVPESAGQDKFWVQAPRDILRAILIYCILKDSEDPDGNQDHPMKPTGEKWKSNNVVGRLVKCNGESLKKYFEDFPDNCAGGAQHLAEAKLAGQLLSILSANTSFFQYLTGTDGDFSIGEWAKDPNPPKKVIFVSNQAMVQVALAPLIGMFFDFSIKTLCSLPDDMNRRVYYILDEFGQLSKIDSIVQLLTQGRSKGGAAFLLIQDQAQIAKIYGQDLVKTIVNNCGNKFYFAVGDESTADFISKELGTIEIERNKESKSFGIGDIKDNISINSDIVEKKIALPSEIMSLTTLTCYAQMTDLPLTLVKLKYESPDWHCKGTIVRNFSIRTSKKDQEIRAQREHEATAEKISQKAVEHNERKWNSKLDSLFDDNDFDAEEFEEITEETPFTSKQSEQPLMSDEELFASLEENSDNNNQNNEQKEIELPTPKELSDLIETKTEDGIF